MFRNILAIIAVTSASPTVAQPLPENKCDRLPTELSGWARSNSAIGPAMEISLGRSFTIPLKPTLQIAFSRPPERAPDPQSYSNIVKISLDRDGVYRLLADRPIWLDVVAANKMQPSESHEHGPSCSGIRKTVNYSLKKGLNFIQLSGSTDPGVRIMIVRNPR